MRLHLAEADDFGNHHFDQRGEARTVLQRRKLEVRLYLAEADEFGDHLTDLFLAICNNFFGSLYFHVHIWIDQHRVCR